MTDSTDLPLAQSMAVETQCRRLIAAFAFLIDHRRYEELAGLFTEDCRFERTGLRVTGIAEMRDFLKDRPAEIVTRHVCGASFFERIEANRAEAVTYMTLFRGEGEDAGPVEVKGAEGVAEFHDVFRNTGEGWRIASRTSKPAIIVKG